MKPQFSLQYGNFYGVLVLFATLSETVARWCSVLYKMGVLKGFTKPKKNICAGVSYSFSCDFCRSFKNTFLQEPSQRMLLHSFLVLHLIEIFH